MSEFVMLIHTGLTWALENVVVMILIGGGFLSTTVYPTDIGGGGENDD